MGKCGPMHGSENEVTGRGLHEEDKVRMREANEGGKSAYWQGCTLQAETLIPGTLASTLVPLQDQDTLSSVPSSNAMTPPITPT